MNIIINSEDFFKLTETLKRSQNELLAASVRIDNDALENGQYRSEAMDADIRIAELTAERDALQAKTTVLEGHAGLLEAFDAYARQFTYNSHPAKPEHFPKSFIWFSAGYSAAGAAPVPEGWQLVQVEPTPEMCDEGAQAIVKWENGAVWPDSWGRAYANRYRKDAMKAYKAMLAAAAPKEQP